MYKKYDKSFWPNHICEWKKSGMSQVEYSKKHQLNAMYFSKVVRRFSKKKTIDHQKLVEIVKIPNPAIIIELEINGKFVLRIPEGASPGSIKQLLDLLENR